MFLPMHLQDTKIMEHLHSNLCDSRFGFGLPCEKPGDTPIQENAIEQLFISPQLVADKSLSINTLGILYSAILQHKECAKHCLTTI